MFGLIDIMDKLDQGSCLITDMMMQVVWKVTVNLIIMR